MGSTDIRTLLAITKDELKLVWVGTNQGLYVGKSDNWEAVGNFEKCTIIALVWDSNAMSLWMGTDIALRNQIRTFLNAETLEQ